jgi:hypothetical protein
MRLPHMAARFHFDWNSPIGQRPCIPVVVVVGAGFVCVLLYYISVGGQADQNFPQFRALRSVGRDKTAGWSCQTSTRCRVRLSTNHRPPPPLSRITTTNRDVSCCCCRCCWLPRRHTESLTVAPRPSASQFLRRSRVGAETPAAAAAAAARGVVVIVNRLTDPLLVSLLRAKSPRKRATQVQVETLGISRCQLSFCSAVPRRSFFPSKSFWFNPNSSSRLSTSLFDFSTHTHWW